MAIEYRINRRKFFGEKVYSRYMLCPLENGAPTRQAIEGKDFSELSRLAIEAGIIIPPSTDITSWKSRTQLGSNFVDEELDARDLYEFSQVYAEQLNGRGNGRGS